MTLQAGLHRVTRARPCPVCGKAGWCSYEGPPETPERAFCPRTESQRRAGALGWVHDLAAHPGPDPRARQVPALADPPPPVDYPRWRELAARYRAALSDDRLLPFATGLGLTLSSLARLGLGWAGDAWAFPMVDQSRRPIGIRLRRPSGFKFAVRGSRSGLFWPAGLGALVDLWLPEGPTDTAALLDLGLAAIGRPNCDGGGVLLREVLGRLRPERAIVLADADGPGRRGADLLAAQLRGAAPHVLVTEPPPGAKDAREALLQGATRQDFEALLPVDGAEARRGARS